MDNNNQNIFPDNKMIGKSEFKRKFIKLFLIFNVYSFLCWGAIFYFRSVPNKDFYYYSIYAYTIFSLILGFIFSQVFFKRARDIFPKIKGQKLKRFAWHISSLSPMFVFYYLFELFTRDGYTDSKVEVPVNNFARNYIVGFTTCFVFSLISTTSIEYFYNKKISIPIQKATVAFLNPVGRHLFDNAISAVKYFEIGDLKCEKSDFCKIEALKKYSKTKQLLTIDSVLISAISAKEIYAVNKKRKPANKKPDYKVLIKLLESLEMANKNISPEKYFFKSWLNGSTVVNSGIEFPLLLIVEMNAYREVSKKYFEMSEKLLSESLQELKDEDSPEANEFRKDAKRMLASIQEKKNNSIF